MDPLSISASIVALLQLTATVIGYTKDAIGAKRDRAQILEEMKALETLLKSLQKRCDQTPAQQGGEWLETLKSLKDSFDSFKEVVEGLEKKMRPRLGWGKVKCMIWSLQKADMKELLDSLERYKLLFNLALQNDHMYLSPFERANSNSGLSRAIAGNVLDVQKMLEELKLTQDG